MCRAFWAALAAVLGVASLAAADTAAPTVNRVGACLEYEVCTNIATTGTCTSGGDEVVVYIGKDATVALNVQGSTGTFTANLQTARQGHDASGGAGQEVFATDLSGSSTVAWAAGPFQYTWVEVDSCSTCSVDAHLLVCPQD